MADNANTSSTEVNWQELINKTAGIVESRVDNVQIRRDLSAMQAERNRQILASEDYEGRVPGAYMARFDRR